MTLYSARRRQVLTGHSRSRSETSETFLKAGKAGKRILVSTVPPHSHELESGVKYSHSDSVDFVSGVFTACPHSKEPQLIPDQRESANNEELSPTGTRCRQVILCVMI